MESCHYAAWGLVQVEGGSRCAGKVGDQAITDVFTGDSDAVSWKTVCAERDDLLRRNNTGDLRCWVNQLDHRVAFVDDLPAELHLRATYIQMSKAVLVVAVVLGLGFLATGILCGSQKSDARCHPLGE